MPPTPSTTGSIDPNGDWAPGGNRDELDRFFDALSNGRRREVVRYLVDVDDPVGLDAIAEHLADTTGSHGTGESVRRQLISLHHTHLPKLESVGVVELTADRGAVSMTDRGSGVASYLEERAGDEGSFGA